jgi:chromosome segregation ATPase
MENASARGTTTSLCELQDVSAVVQVRTQELQMAEQQMAAAQSSQREAEEELQHLRSQVGQLRVMCRDQFEKLERCACCHNIAVKCQTAGGV